MTPVSSLLGSMQDAFYSQGVTGGVAEKLQWACRSKLTGSCTHGCPKPANQVRFLGPHWTKALLIARPSDYQCA